MSTASSTNIINPFQQGHCDDPVMTTLVQKRLENINRLNLLKNEESNHLQQNFKEVKDSVTCDTENRHYKNNLIADIESYLEKLDDNGLIGEIRFLCLHQGGLFIT